VDSWDHPAGPTGRDRVTPTVLVPGIVTGEVVELETMIENALHPSFVEYVQMGRDLLVPKHSRGTAASLAATAVENALFDWSEVEELRAALAARELELAQANERVEAPTREALGEGDLLPGDPRGRRP
jgi:hypothetical protein